MSHLTMTVSHVGFCYPDGHQALDEVDFTVRPGESVAVIGANGAGKSTLLLLLTGFLFASQGEVRLGNARISKAYLPELRRHVGLVFQNPDDQLFMPTVFDDVAFGPLNMRLSAEDVRTVTMQALETVGAAHLVDRPPWQLSGGQKRAVAIAGVLAMHPDVLILDEPSDALDPGARRRLIHLLQTFEHTKIIATHDLDLVLDVCTRVIVLHEGRILADAHPLEVFADAALLARASLEKPLSLQPRGCYAYDLPATPSAVDGPPGVARPSLGPD